MSTTTDQVLINLNSRDASQYKNGTSLSDVVFAFRNLLHLTSDVLTVQLSLQNFQCVCSFYAVNESCNHIRYLYAGSPFTLTLTPGNYNANTLITEIVARFLANGHLFQLTINRQTGRLTFQCTLAAFTLYSDSSANQILGLGPSNLVSAANIVICPYACNLLGVTAIRLASQLLPTKGYDSKRGGSCSSVLASIPVDNSSAAFGLLSYTNLSNFSPILRVTNIDLVDIQITDQNGTFVNFNGQHWSASLCLTLTKKIIDLSHLVIAKGGDQEEPAQEDQQVENGWIEEQQFE